MMIQELIAQPSISPSTRDSAFWSDASAGEEESVRVLSRSIIERFARACQSIQEKADEFYLSQSKPEEAERMMRLSVELYKGLTKPLNDLLEKSTPADRELVMRGVGRLETAESVFNSLADQWRHERGATSWASQMAMQPSYQSIIGMGPTAIPFILRELDKQPDHWFWALRSITRENPVKPHQRGKIREMAQAWLDWARNRGYQW